MSYNISVRVLGSEWVELGDTGYWQKPDVNTTMLVPEMHLSFDPTKSEHVTILLYGNNTSQFAEATFSVSELKEIMTVLSSATNGGCF
jgi:hypothetical protein